MNIVLLVLENLHLRGLVHPPHQGLVHPRLRGLVDLLRGLVQQVLLVQE